MPENHFNLIDEPWIPVVNGGLKSLKDIFSGEGAALGGTAREKIALLKLLIAIGQAAATPENEKAWRELGVKGLGEACLAYLNKHHDKFYLYGERPFLQMPVYGAEKKSYGAFLPHIACGNTSRLTQLQNEAPLDDAERAVLLACEMGMCLGGKKPDRHCKLNPKVEKRTAPPGPGMCSLGLQHAFLLGESVLESVWLNLLDLTLMGEIEQLEQGIGVAPWEKMPETENCPRAEELKVCLMGRLVPLARFCLLEDDGLRSTEGLVHPNYLSDMVDPSTSVNRDQKKPKMLWTDPEKRPWRNLPAMLGFLDAEKANGKYECMYLKKGLPRLQRFREKGAPIERVHVWCGGFKVSSNAGEQYASGADDNVESDFLIDLKDIGARWYESFSHEMSNLDKYSRHLYGCVNSFFSSQKLDAAHAKTASGLFWDRIEPYFQDILDNCLEPEKLRDLDKKFRGIACDIYNEVCPQATARQRSAWAEYRPFRKKLDESVKTAKEDADDGN